MLGKNVCTDLKNKLHFKINYGLCGAMVVRGGLEVVVLVFLLFVVRSRVVLLVGFGVVLGFSVLV